jgi:hypothetical protein
MWLLVDEQPQYWWNYPHFFETLELLLYVQALPAPTILVSSTRMGPNPCSFSARSNGNVHVTTRGWIQLAVLVELSPLLTHWSRYCTYRLFQPNYFGIFQLDGPNPLFLFSLQWVVTHRTTRGWIQLAGMELSPFLWDIGAVIVRTGSSSSNYFWYLSTRMGPNPLFLFSMLQWVVTYMWLLVDEFNSQYWWNYPHFFDTLSRYCTYRLFQLQLFLVSLN